MVKKIVAVILAAGLLLVAIQFLPPHIIADNSFRKTDRPLVIAHRGGAGLAPENTVVAFDNAVALGVDILEFDVHLTKDKQIVVFHDRTLERTTNGQGLLVEKTWSELSALDAGYYFVDHSGDYPYRGQGVQIPTVRELFSRYADMPMVIEMKQDDPQLARQLADLIVEFGLQQQVIVVSFYDGMSNHFREASEHTIATAAGPDEIQMFVASHLLFLDPLLSPDVHAFQLPVKAGAFSLDGKRLLQNLHRRNIAIHYWTIDEPAEMQRLIELGADGLITNFPDRMLQLLP